MDGQGTDAAGDGAGRVVDRDAILAALRDRLPNRVAFPQVAGALFAVAHGQSSAEDRGDAADMDALLPLSPRILQNLHDGVVISDGGGRIVFFNDAAEAIFACRRGEVLGRSLATLLPARPWAATPRSAVPVAPESVRLAERAESVGRRPRGEDFPVELTAIAVGAVVVVTVTDLSDRKRLEAESARRYQILRSIIDNMPGGVTVFGADLEMIIYNHRFREMLAFPEELFAHGLPSFRTLVEFNAMRGEYGDGDVAEVIAASIERARHPAPYVYERRRPDGTVLEIRGMPLPDGGFVTIHIDITDRRRAEDEAKRYTTYLHSVLEAMPQGISVFDENLELVLWNQALLKILDLPADLVRAGIPFSDIIRFNSDRGEYGTEDPDEYIRWRTRMALRFEPHRFERVRPDGQTLDVHARPIHRGVTTAGFVATYADVTENKKADEMVRRANELMEEAIGFSPTYVWEIDREGCFTFLKGTQKVLGYEAEDLLGTRFTGLQCGGAQCHEHAAMLGIAFDNRSPLEHTLSCVRHKDGSHIWISISAHPIFDRQGAFNGYRGVNVDVTELTRVRQELERMALHDPLTGLANRRKFLDRFKLEAARQTRHGQPLSLLIADIDLFKAVNDQFGHLTGDICLKRVADVLSLAVREIDLVARFGGEEFIVLLPETSPQGALAAAEKLRRSVESLIIPIDTRLAPLTITISIGVACMPADRQVSFDDLMHVADQGLYGAKQAGRNSVRSGNPSGRVSGGAQPQTPLGLITDPAKAGSALTP